LGVGGSDRTSIYVLVRADQRHSTTNLFRGWTALHLTPALAPTHPHLFLPLPPSNSPPPLCSPTPK
jgi:hypothetical protein